MQNPILDENETLIYVRTKDLVLAEVVTISAVFVSIIWTILSPNIPIMTTFCFIIGPLGYTLLWSYKSIQYEKSNSKEELQSGITILLFLWSCFECLPILPSSLFFFLESISKGFFIIKIFYILPFLVTATFTYYLIKSFGRSMKIDQKKPSIKD